MLQFIKDETSLDGYDTEALKVVRKAEEAWKNFLLGRSPHPGPFQQHLLPLGAIESSSAGTDVLSPNINRYFMRMIDKGVLQGNEGCIFVYSKCGRFVILGFVRESRSNRWKGTKVHVERGTIEPGAQYAVPGELFGYMNERAKHAAEIMSSISPRQSEKIDASFQKNADKFVGSDEFIAMQYDVGMFGDAAFTRNRRTRAPGDSKDV
ncbi:hypothetical protein [Nitrospira sp. Nam74]